MGVKTALTIAGSDCSGGAGIQADLKTFMAHGVYGASVITSVVAENTCEVLSLSEIEPDLVTDQIDAVFSDIAIDAVKIGMLPSTDCVEAVVAGLRQRRPAFVVLDPVMISTSGTSLMAGNTLEALVEELLPLVSLVTPNMAELQVLHGVAPNFAGAVLEKGGHAIDPDTSMDVLVMGERHIGFAAPRIKTENTHGTGCTLSSAIAANVALGFELPEAIRRAKVFVTAAIMGADVLEVGKGHGPLNHFASAKTADDLVKVIELD